MKYSVILFVAALVLAGCASKVTNEEIALDANRAQAVRDKAEAERISARQERMTADLAQIPKWALDPPQPDGQGIYAVGMADAEQLTVSMRKAMLEAEFGLAKLYRQELSGSERGYMQERGDKSIATQYTGLIDKLVSRVQIVGFEVLQQEVKPVRGSYHTWVLLKMPYSQFNKVLQEQRAAGVEESVRAAFDDLEARVRARQEDRLREDSARQGMRLKELAAQTGAVSSLSPVPQAPLETAAAVPATEK